MLISVLIDLSPTSILKLHIITKLSHDGVCLSILLLTLSIKYLESCVGGAGEQLARLTPLSGTCIGNPEGESRTYQSRLVHRYFIRSARKGSQEVTNKVLRRFWEIEKLPNKEECQMSIEQKTAMKLLEVSHNLTWVIGH